MRDLILLLLAGAAALSAKVSFNREIRPIMADTCFRCHGPDRGARMADLRLDLREEALRKTKSGVIPIVPGRPEESAIVDRVLATNARVMPPKFAHKDLSERQKALIRQWVAEGAEYEGHWAYTPIRRPETPPAASSLIRNPIDNFIQARLKLEDLSPSPEADRRTLLRRVTLDLTGLPPTAAETAAFLKNTAPDAYEATVDRLLASPRHAERQAQVWLDAIRYSDTCGFHGDNPLPAWPFRDWVLRAFRDNKPFDEFTREQLAGDLLPNATDAQRVASAFNRMNRTSAEGGLQPQEYLAKYAADRVRTTSNVWLGSTLGCAECHDHKFDPFTARDFYSMKAFFADIRETGLVPDRGPNAWGTQLALPTPDQKAQRERIVRDLEEVRAKLEAAAPSISAADLRKRFDAGELSWRQQMPLAARSTSGAKLTVLGAEPIDSMYEFRGSLVSERKAAPGLVAASGPAPDNDTYVVTLKPGAGEWTALGVEIIQDEKLPGVRMARGSDRVMLTEVEAGLSPNETAPERPLGFTLATAGNQFPISGLPAMAAIDSDPKTGWGTAIHGETRNLFLALRFGEKLTTTAASVLTVRLQHDAEPRRAVTGRFRLYLSNAVYAWPGTDSIGLRDPLELNSGLPPAVLSNLRGEGEDRKPLEAYLRFASLPLEPLVVEAARLESQLGLLDAAIPRVVVTESGPPAVTRILRRGDFLDEAGDIVDPAIPGFLGKVAEGRRATRLDLANWIVSRENPLTARVFVNRLWRQFFGTGLTKSLDDLGSQGEIPTHLELLDWLAASFMERWDVRQSIRTIVTSHAYRQSSLSKPDLDARDPGNRLLARQSRFRVDAESVRDLALAVSGLLEERFGGPSIRPPQPESYLAALNFPKRDYSASRGREQYRRGIYVHWQRSFLHPSLLAFDAPTREECTLNRVSSNTPLQALVLLNDPVFIEAARVFAQRILTEGGRTFPRQLQWAFQLALNREPTADELRILTGLQRASHRRFNARPAAAAELLKTGESVVPSNLRPADLAAMTTVARAVLNLHELITRN
ncbi:MAG: DUF1553 domain-containing protein [Bryobacterales bacterium]|nr:DUF1553 domain-containing protein [Bryobacterales bacterium]